MNLGHCNTKIIMNYEPFARNTLILLSFGCDWRKMTIIFVPIRPNKSTSKVEELEESEETEETN